MSLVVICISLLIGILLAEIGLRTFGGLWLRNYLRKTIMLLRVFHVAVGDDARQSALLHCGRITLQFSLTLMGIIALLVFIAMLAPWALKWNETQQLIYIVVTSIAASGWWLLSRPGISPPTAPPPIQVIKSSNAYGTLERWLHWLALEPAVVRHLAFDLERQYALPKRDTTSQKIHGPVYVCGLARSGTTMLLRILDQIDIFRSPTYRDMPFVLAPNLWKLITRHVSRQAIAAQRAHGDGISIDFDSPEGFEEVFWSTFDTSSADKNCLGADEPSVEVLAAFTEYRAIVANPRTEPQPTNGAMRRYLSKNNNNLLRLPSLCADPAATVLLVYRNPVVTARSLHRQHQRFCTAQTEDRFVRTYMGWLAHHEFGLDHLPFCFAVPMMDSTLTPEDPNYWLDYWNAVYQHVLAQDELQFHLVNHDELCAKPVELLDVIFASLGVLADSSTMAQLFIAPKSANSDGFTLDLLQRAENTYCALLNSPKNITITTKILE